MLRDHSPIVIDKFNGLWQRGDVDNTPLDHWADCENVQLIGNNAFGTRDGINISQSAVGPLSNIKRIYNYPTSSANTYLVLIIDGANGKIYHVVNSTTVYGPILTVAGMTDFAFVPYAGRAYLSPFGTFTTGDLNIQKGLSGEFLYVYLGAGVAARKAAGATPAGTLTIANGGAGYTDAGFHLFGVVGETDTGYLSAPVAFASHTTSKTLSLNFSTVPLFSGTQWVKRHIVATKVIKSYTGNTTGYQYYFIPNATIPDNTTTTLNAQSFYDADLLEDASHLLDNLSEVPAGAVLTLYHNRLCLAATFTDISLMHVSELGEPEAFNQIEGLIIVPPDGNPITNAQELRDVLYVFKRSRTVSFIDNGDVPSSWPLIIIDNALGAPVHGIATVLDSGSASTDFLIVCTYQGINLFNGRYANPELSWKIDALWRALDRDLFRLIQIVNDPIKKQLYIILPTGNILVGNYANGMDPIKVRWTIWSFQIGVNTIAIVNIDDLVIGMDT